MPEPGTYRRLKDNVEVRVTNCTGSGWNANVSIHGPYGAYGVRLENFWKKYEPIGGDRS